MKCFDKHDYINIFSIIAVFFVVFIFILINNGTSYVSIIDYSYQHYMIPEYFRKLFYETGNLFPSYAFNLGMGQNIFNFSYYGYLSPIVLFSYFLPFVKMKTYLEIVSVIVIIISIVLFYYFISIRTNDKKIRFVCTFLFIMAVPLIFHTHRHIMFIYNIPFVLLSLIFINKKRYLLLTLSNVFLITTSYFFSIPGLIAIFMYAIYLYLDENKFNFSCFLKRHLYIGMYFIISVLISMSLLLPSLLSILNNRFKEASEESILHYMIPNVDFSFGLYTSYSMGLTALFIIAIIYGIVYGKKSNRFLGFVFLILICIPVVNYTLNGFMYFNGKVLIPFIPLAMLLIEELLTGLLINKKKSSFLFVFLILVISVCGCISYNHVYFYIFDVIFTLLVLLLSKKVNNNILFVLCILGFFVMMGSNIGDTFTKNDAISNQYDSEIKELVNKIDDSSIYRVADLSNKSYNLNNIRDINQYKTTMYSSVTNKYYKDFYWNVFEANNPNRNDAIFSDISNPLFNIYFGNKYMISSRDFIGYKSVASVGDYSLYKNDAVFSIGYVNRKVMSEKDLDALDYPYNMEALLNYTIVDDDVSSSFDSSIVKLDKESDFDKKIKDKYSFSLESSKTFKYKLNENLSNKILIIKFDMDYSQSCDNGDTIITINGVRNTLTCSSWKYHNHNYLFTYVLSNVDDNTIEISLTDGKYEISDVDIYMLDYDDIKDIKNSHDEFMIDKDSTKGDVIRGSVNVLDDGYFTLSIPYDKGYNINVDGRDVSYERVNKSFIGFKIDKGNHDITIRYTAPGLRIGKMLSVLGIVLFLIVIVVNKGVIRYEKDFDDSSLL